MLPRQSRSVRPSGESGASSPIISSWASPRWAAPRPGIRSGLPVGLARETSLQFAVAGDLLFLGARIHADATYSGRRRPGDADRPDLSAAMRELLVSKWIEEEVQYREGVP